MKEVKRRERGREREKEHWSAQGKIKDKRWKKRRARHDSTSPEVIALLALPLPSSSLFQIIILIIFLKGLERFMSVIQS